MGARGRWIGGLAACALGVGIASLGSAGPALAAPGNAADPTYATDGNVNAIVRSGDTIYLGGQFTRVGPPTGPLASIGASSATVDASLPAVSGGLATVIAVAPDGSGGYYIGGDFTHVGGVPRMDAAHILANDTVDPNWAPNPNGIVFALAVGAGSVFIGGGFSGTNSIDGTATRNYVAAVDPTTGALRPGWNPNPSNAVETIAVNGSTVYLGGAFNGPNAIDGLTRTYAAAVNATTGADTGWDPALDNDVLAINVEPLLDGAIVYLGGDFSTVDGQTRNYAGAVDGTTGSNVLGWNPNTDGAVDAIAFGAGKVYIGGLFTHVSGSARRYVAEVSPLSGAPSAWNAGLVGSGGSVQALALSADGGLLYLGGEFSDVNTTTPRQSLGAVYTTAGAPMGIAPGTVTGWNPSPDGNINALAVGGTHVLAAGDFDLIGGVPRLNAAAISARDGKVTPWDPEPSSFVSAIAASGGTVYLGGDFTMLGGSARASVGAVDAATGSATSWNPGTNGEVNALAVAGGNVYVGGGFSIVGGQARENVAAVSATSGTTTSWAPLLGGGVNAIAISGNTIYLGGSFAEVGVTPRKNVAAIDTAGNLLPWDPEADQQVYALAVGNGVVYLGGQFQFVGTGGNQVSRPNLAAVNPTSGIAAAWNPAPDNSVRALALSGGTVYAGGLFEHVGGQARRSIVGLDPTSGMPTAWNPMATLGYVIAVAAASDGTIYVGGGFPGFDLSAQPNFASFSELPTNSAAPSIVGSAQPGKTLTCTIGTWTGSMPFSYSYQWLRDGTPIAGVTSYTYVVAQSDIGHKLVCRVTTTNLAGSTSVESAPVTAGFPAPRLTGLSITPAAFKRGATIRYSDTEASLTTFTVRRAARGSCGRRQHAHRCTRYVRVGSFGHADTVGKNHFPFRARVGGRALRPGTYLLQARPQAHGVFGQTVAAGFRVK